MEKKGHLYFGEMGTSLLWVDTMKLDLDNHTKILYIISVLLK